MAANMQQTKPNMAVFLIQLMAGIFILTGIYYGGYYYWCEDIPVPESMELSARFSYAFRWTLPMVLVMLVLVWQAVGRRVTTAAGTPMSGNEHLMAIFKNVLTNTHEQLMMAVLLIMITVTYCDTPITIKIVPIYAITFVIGRILFVIGYRIHPFYRATGNTITFFATTTLMFYVLYLMFTKGLIYGLSTAAS